MGNYKIEIDDNKTEYYGIPRHRNIFYKVSKGIINADLKNEDNQYLKNRQEESEDDSYIYRKEELRETDTQKLSESLMDIMAEFLGKGYIIYFSNDKKPLLSPSQIPIFRYAYDGTVTISFFESKEDNGLFVHEIVADYKRDFTLWVDILKEYDDMPFILLVEKKDKLWQLITR